MPEALVLGATGFIGGHIAREALARGWRVRGLRRRPGSEGELGQMPIEWHLGDIEHPDELAAAVEGVEVVFHAAGFYPQSAISTAAAVRVGVAQTRAVLEAARRSGVRRLVYTSTLSTIGRPPAEEDRLADERDEYIPGTFPRSAYYESKWAMEREVLQASPGTVVVNPTFVLGPGDVHMTVARYLLAAARGLARLSIAAQTNAVDVRDVAAGHLAAARSGRPGERYILGGENVSITQLLSRIARQANRPAPWAELPVGWIVTFASLSGRLPGLWDLKNHMIAARHWQAYNVTKARAELSWSTRPLDETLQDALEWLEARGYRWRRGAR